MMSEYNEGSTQGTTRSTSGVTWVLGSLLLIAVAVIIYLLVTGGEEKGTPADSAVVAKVNGVEITKDEAFDHASDTNSIVEQAVLAELIRQEAEKNNITITQEEIDQELEDYRQQFIQNFPSEEIMNQQLAMTGRTLDELLDGAKKFLPLELRMRKLLSEQIDTSSEKVAQFFAENEENIKNSLQVQASHILVEEEELANSLLEQIRNGADFAELAKEHSVDPGSQVNGGELGYFGRGEMVPEFEEAAYSLEIGEVSDIVPTSYGYHIIKLTDKETLTLEENEEEIKDMLFLREFQNLAPSFISTLREAADVEIM